MKYTPDKAIAFDIHVKSLAKLKNFSSGFQITKGTTIILPKLLNISDLIMYFMFILNFSLPQSNRINIESKSA